jgi:flagellar basal body-associated protein FliL
VLRDVFYVRVGRWTELFCAVNTKKLKVVINIIVFILLAIVAVLALTFFAMFAEGERVNLRQSNATPAASPK